MECLQAWMDARDHVRSWQQDDVATSFDSSAVDEALDVAETASEEIAYLRIARTLADELAVFLKLVAQDGEGVGSSFQSENVSALLRTAGTLRSVAIRLMSAEGQRLEASASAESALVSANNARTAAGTAGEQSLAKWFGEYGKSEHIASWVFRGVAFLGLASTAALAWWFFLESEKTELEVTSLVLRSAIVLAVAAFSTYSIRLAGQHRHQGNWAKSIAVQLKSFSAFLDPVESPAIRDSIYEQFAGRVFGAPPDAQGGSSETTIQITAQDLISLIPKASK